MRDRETQKRKSRALAATHSFCQLSDSSTTIGVTIRTEFRPVCTRRQAGLDIRFWPVAAVRSYCNECPLLAPLWTPISTPTKKQKLNWLATERGKGFELACPLRRQKYCNLKGLPKAYFLAKSSGLENTRRSEKTAPVLCPPKVNKCASKDTPLPAVLSLALTL